MFAFSGKPLLRRKATITYSQLSETIAKEVIDAVNGGLKTDIDGNMDYIKDLITAGEAIRLSDYNNEHVMYFYITNIASVDGHLICKIGYTSNITKRIGSLVSEFEGSNFHLVGLKRIRNVSDEQSFHSMLKCRYPQLISSSHKEELYIFDKCLWEEFSLLPEFRNIDKLTCLTNALEDYKTGTFDEETLKLILRIIESVPS
jgi:hypothetical protein